jgi:glycosyltransferase involved in cell wall biosynthesis
LQLTQQDQNQRKAIIHLLPHFNSDGNGVVYVATDLACAQSAAGLSVACIGGRSGSLVGLLQDRSVTTYVIPSFKSGPILKLRGMFRLWRLFKVLRPEVVHAHTIPMALIAKLLQPLFGFSLITSAHNGPRLRNFLLTVGDRVICVSAAVAKGMRRLPVSDRKLRIVRNGPLGSPRRAGSGSVPLKVVVSNPAIVTLAGLHAHKGIQDLIEAFAMVRKSVPDLSMHILGEGPERSRLKMQAARLNCDDCSYFEGFVEDPRSYLAQADIFVLPSHREAFGLSLAEAREAGCAMIGTSVGGIPEVLERGRCGTLVPAGNPLELGRILVELLTDEELLRFWQGRASSNLSWLRVDRVFRETMEVYAELRTLARRDSAELLQHHDQLFQKGR